MPVMVALLVCAVSVETNARAPTQTNRNLIPAIVKRCSFTFEFILPPELVSVDKARLYFAPRLLHSGTVMQFVCSEAGLNSGLTFFTRSFRGGVQHQTPATRVGFGFLLIAQLAALQALFVRWRMSLNR